MKKTNYFRDFPLCVKNHKLDNPNCKDADAEVNELIRKGVYKIGRPPVTRYADHNGRYYVSVNDERKD